MPGLFITFEGPEGSGKSTHAEALVRRLDASGYIVCQVREPGGTATGEAIRNILQHDVTGEPVAPETELLLFEASRAQLVQRVIKPALDEGGIVVCDRFADSTTAYQGYGRGFDVERMVRLNEWATGGVTPDATFLLDVDVHAGFDRLHARNRDSGVDKDRFEREAFDFHERVRRGYQALAKRWPERIRVISSDAPVETVSEQIWMTVQAMLSDVDLKRKSHEG